jgi:hypothetical protein
LANLDHPVLKLDASVYDITLCFSLVVPIFHRYHLSFAIFITFHRALPYTEQSHVRNLKVLDRVFYRPCLPYWTTASAIILLICSSFNLPDMLEILPRTFQHTRESGRKRDQLAVETVGDILVAMVSIFFVL